MLEPACYQNKVCVLRGHLADVLAIGMWEWTCLIKVAMLVAPPAIMPDLAAESGFEPVSFLSLLWHFNFGHRFGIALRYVQGPLS